MNRAFLLLSASVAYKSFAEFEWRSARDFDSAYLSFKIGSFWPLIFALILHYVLIFAERRKLLRNPLTLTAIYAPALALSVIELTTHLLKGEPTTAYWGWTYQLPDDLWMDYIAGVWILAVIILSLFWLLQHYLRLPDQRRRQQARYVLMGASIPLTVFAVSVLWVPLLKITITGLTISVPDLSSPAYAIGLAFIGYAMWRYQLFTLTPAVAADEILATMSDPLVLVSPEGRIVTANRAALAISGYESADLIGQPVDTIFPDQENGKALLKGGHFQALGGTGLVSDAEMTLRTRGGRSFPISLSMSMMRDKDGDELGIVCIGIDLTERKRSEQALLESNRRLEETLEELRKVQRQIVQEERLRALGLMASGIAHNLNNALLPILGYSELLLEHPESLDDKQTVTRRLKAINEATKDAAQVVRRLREFYRPRDEDEPFLPVDLMQVFQRAVHLTRPNWKDQAQAMGIDISVQTDFQQVPCIDGNEAELREVLVNIILNAIDAMPNGGTINLQSRLDGDHVVLEVGDTGVGMSPEIRQRSLEPFFTTKGLRGTGLGLALAYGVIQRHAGTIDVQSEQGKGTDIVVRLPVGGGSGSR